MTKHTKRQTKKMNKKYISGVRKKNPRIDRDEDLFVNSKVTSHRRKHFEEK